MPADIATFRTAFPEFTEAAASNDAVTYWLETAELLVNRKVFGRLADQAVLNVAAHYIATATLSAKSGAIGLGAVPSGATTGKSVGGASVSYDPSIGAVEGSGIYNATVYGRRFVTWSRMFGAGGLQL